MRDAALTMPHFRNFPVHTDRGKHFMRPVSKKAALLYVGDWSTNDVFVYDYPSGTAVGTLGSFNEPYGMCVNGKRDVYVSNYGSGDVDEIGPGGTIIQTYSTSGAEAIGCSISPKGDVAVTTFDPGGVVVFTGGNPSKGTTYSDSACGYQWTMGYDPKGNLVGVGQNATSGTVNVCALLSGSSSETTLSTSGITIDYPGGTTWDGNYIALGDQEAGGDYQTGVWRATISGSTITAVGGEIVFSDSCYNDYADDVNPFFAGITPKSKVQATTMVGPNLWCVEEGTGKVDYWNYPAGGAPSGDLPSPPTNPYGAAVTGAAPTPSPTSPPAKRKVVLSFAGGSDGETPNTKLVSDSSGNLYGTMESGGTSNDGIVFELVKTGKKYSETVLHSFGGSDGAQPQGALLLVSGVIYGTTAQGGNSYCECGVIFSLTPGSGGSYTYATLYQFQGGSDGATPVAGLIKGSSATMYGTTEYGGNVSCATGCGTIFQYDPTHGYAQDVQLSASAGAFPVAPLTLINCSSSCSPTALAGVATQGGSGSCTGGCGTIFEADKVGSSWTVNAAYSFGSQSGDGSDPQSPVNQVAESPPAFVGTTKAGGGSCNCGTVYYARRAATGTWSETLLHQFASGTSDGQYPVGNLVVDSSHAVLGNTYAGGEKGVGAAFAVTYTGAGSSPHESVIYNYNAATGSTPLAGFALAGSGSDDHHAKRKKDHLYITASAGGKQGFGSGMVIIHEEGSGKLTPYSPPK
jgi:uncharacterized repeat protein (TIGR03803 family)